MQYEQSKKKRFCKQLWWKEISIVWVQKQMTELTDEVRTGPADFIL